MDKNTSIENIFHIRDLQYIAENVGDLINHDVVIFKRSGEIIAARNKKRLGHFSSHIKEMLDNNDSIYVVDNDVNPDSILHGINLPLMLDGQPVGAFGITGEPEEVRPFSSIMQVLIQQNLKALSNESAAFNISSERTGFLYSWIMQDPGRDDADFLKRSRHLGIDTTLPRLVCVLRLPAQDSAYRSAGRVPGHVLRMLQLKNPQHLAAELNGQLILLLAGEDADAALQIIDDIEELYGVSMPAGLCITPCRGGQIRAGWETALSACDRSARQLPYVTVRYDSFSVEYLFSRIDREVMNSFREKITGALGSEQDDYLKAVISYVNHNRSVEKAAAELNIHKNTLQYRLNRIGELTGCSPRDTRDLMLLYMAAVG